MVGTCEYMNTISSASGTSPRNRWPRLGPVVDGLKARVAPHDLVIVIPTMLSGLQSPYLPIRWRRGAFGNTDGAYTDMQGR